MREQVKLVPSHEHGVESCHVLYFRERPSHYRAGGSKTFFLIIFFQLMLKLDFFHTLFEARLFFSQTIEGQSFFLNSVFIFRVETRFFSDFQRIDARFFFFATHQSKKIFQHTCWAKLFFSAKSSAR